MCLETPTENENSLPVRKIKLVLSSRNAITLAWPMLQEGSRGFKTQVLVEPLGASECYFFRLQVGRDEKVGEWSTFVASTKDRAGRPGLLVAAQRGDAEMVQLLLAAGADPNGGGGVFTSGKTPLMAAAAAPCGDRPDVCRALCDRGARWDLRDRNGRTAAHYAAGAGHLGCVQLAVDVSRATVEQVDGRGWTPLVHAIILRANLNVVSALTAASPRCLQMTDRIGQTPLHIAALTGQREAMSLLIRHGADPRRKNHSGHSAHYLARFWAPSSDGVDAVSVDAALTVATAAAALLRAKKKSQKPTEKKPCLPSTIVSRRTSSDFQGQAPKTSDGETKRSDAT